MTDGPDDDLRARLSRLDPAAAGTPVDPATSPRARELMERATATFVETPAPLDELGDRRRRRPLLAAAAAVVVGGSLLLGPGDDGDPGPRPADAPVALSLPPADVAGSCVVFDAQFLAEMPVAFAGTVTAVEEEQVTLEVDRWYRGGTADLVTVAVPVNSSAALDGVDFRAGERFLVSAAEGVVNGCGFSGPASAELEIAYRQAFGD